MDNILLCSNQIPLVTSIHNTFIEKYMLRANGSYVKVYLYLSKCIQAGQDDLSISSLADQMENTEKDILRALNYWEKQGLLHITRSKDKTTILGIDVLNPDTLSPSASETSSQVLSDVRSADSSPETSDTRAYPVPQATQRKTVPADKSVPASAMPGTAASDPPPALPDAAETAQAKRMSERNHRQTTFQMTAEQTKQLAENEEFRWTCNVIESYLSRPVKPKELQLIAYLYDSLHFTPELILYLYEYCISLGKTSPNYIQAVAVSWNEKNVRTPEEAQNASAEYNASYTAIANAFALNRPLAAIERRYTERWHRDWHMDLSVILEACNRTMLKLQHADFKYTEGILDHWRQAGIRTLSEIETADQEFAQRKSTTAGSTRTSGRKNQTGMVQHGLSKKDADALEKQLLKY